MPVPLILARTFKQAHEFASERLDLKVGHYRVNPSPSTIRSVRNTQIYLVPGWNKRSDRFGIQGALRFCRLEVIDVATWEQAPPDPRGDLTERQLKVAYRYNTLLDLPAESSEETSDAPEPEVEPEQPKLEELVSDESIFAEPDAEPDAEPTQKPKARRRSKCKTCDQLHYKDEPCPDLEG